MSRLTVTKRKTTRSYRTTLFGVESLEQRNLFAADMVPDFHLVDVNPNSTTFNTQFSPRDLLGQTGAVYFAHST